VKLVLGFLTIAWVALVGWAAFRRLARGAKQSIGRYTYALVLGGFCGAACVWLERLVMSRAELSFDVKSTGVAGALMATFLLAAPLEEAAKVLVVWPLYSSRRMHGPRYGALYAVLAATGFAAVEAGMRIHFGSQPVLDAFRSALGTLSHIFCAAAWGYALGSGRRGSRWFSSVWILAVLLHGLYDHILWGRGPGYLTALLPILAFMAFGSAVALRELELFKPPLRGLVEPPSLRQVREALRPADQPVMLRWVFAGMFVTLGLVIVLSALSVFVGRRMGIDFTLADETDVRSAGPLALLGTAVLAAFPLAGFLIARANAAGGVLEPALSTLVALVALVVLLSVTAPAGVLLLLALTPIAIALCCGGAWLGSEH